MTSKAKTALETYARIGKPPDRGNTLPMRCDAKGLLWLVQCWLRGRLSPEDREFIERAMQEYGRACVAEATAAQPD